MTAFRAQGGLEKQKQRQMEIPGRREKGFVRKDRKRLGRTRVAIGRLITGITPRQWSVQMFGLSLSVLGAHLCFTFTLLFSR